MAATNNHGLLTYLERCRVSAPPKTVGERTLTPTFMDLLNISVHPVNRVYLYEFPHSTSHFIKTLIPKLKHSLSITLQHFFPYASKLVMFPNNVTKKPEIRHVEGDSIALTFAESSLDFVDLVGDHPRECNKFHLLLPQLECPCNEYDQNDHDYLTKFPIFALQITIFPHLGISIGLTTHHILCDAKTAQDFLMAWTSITKNGTDEVYLAGGFLPFYDRSSVIKYSNTTSIDEIYMADQPWIQILEKMYQPRRSVVTQNDRVVGTFHLTKTQINLLKKWVLVQLPALEYVSSFIVGCAYVWICMAKSRNIIDLLGKKKDDDEFEEIEEAFSCHANLRGRLDPPVVPEGYFGNCVVPCITTAKRALLIGNKGFPKAVEVLVKCITDTVKSNKDVFEDAETWMQRITSLRKPAISMAGSPKFKVYDVDFGWGKPKKHEGIKINSNASDVITIDASRESPQDLEFGLSLCAKQMSAFIGIFDHEISSILSHHH
uniref:malonyl-coenzyme A:anthocyanin 3-O-glucoside-6''-O-malonyltransferase-like n=1 Tax=Erigeron canadensis TaxID=72917 RepID=UPI001CB96187|nr:malonyl-coenzyme A:anthocyanin 3-O-glucoside-6''-O-malonyltransferase-like [Erigeron canadensis]